MTKLNAPDKLIEIAVSATKNALNQGVITADDVQNIADSGLGFLDDLNIFAEEFFAGLQDVADSTQKEANNMNKEHGSVGYGIFEAGWPIQSGPNIGIVRRYADCDRKFLKEYTGDTVFIPVLTIDGKKDLFPLDACKVTSLDRYSQKIVRALTAMATNTRFIFEYQGLGSTVTNTRSVLIKEISLEAGRFVGEDSFRNNEMRQFYFSRIVT